MELCGWPNRRAWRVLRAWEKWVLHTRAHTHGRMHTVGRTMGKAKVLLNNKQPSARRLAYRLEFTPMRETFRSQQCSKENGRPATREVPAALLVLVFSNWWASRAASLSLFSYQENGYNNAHLEELVIVYNVWSVISTQHMITQRVVMLVNKTACVKALCDLCSYLRLGRRQTFPECYCLELRITFDKVLPWLRKANRFPLDEQLLSLRGCFLECCLVEKKTIPKPCPDAERKGFVRNQLCLPTVQKGRELQRSCLALQSQTLYRSKLDLKPSADTHGRHPPAPWLLICSCSAQRCREHFHEEKTAP